MKYFTLSELTHSDTAVSVRIDNTPTAAAVPLMVELIDRVLDPIREHWGLPIRVTSGYRCPERNVELMSLIRAMQLIGRIALTECYMGPSYRYVHVAYKADEIDPYPFF